MLIVLPTEFIVQFIPTPGRAATNAPGQAKRVLVECSVRDSPARVYFPVDLRLRAKQSRNREDEYRELERSYSEIDFYTETSLAQVK